MIIIPRPITKWNKEFSGRTLPEAVRKAYGITEAEKPGSPHLELPEDVADQTTDKGPVPHPLPQEQQRPRTSQIRKAAELINESKSPLILAGNGIIQAKATKHLRKFLTSTKLPVVHTFMGKGAVPDDNRLSLYSIGLQTKTTVNKGFEQTDLVTAIGYDLVEYASSLWNPDS